MFSVSGCARDCPKEVDLFARLKTGDFPSLDWSADDNSLATDKNRSTSRKLSTPVRLLMERLAHWLATCRLNSVVSVPIVARLAQAASAESQPVLSLPFRGSTAQGVSNGNPTAQNETSSSVIGNAPSWDSQRQMHVELSSIQTTQIESIAFPTSPIRMLTSTDAHRFESKGSGLVSIAGKLATSPIGLVLPGPTQASGTQITAPSSPGMTLSIQDMQSASAQYAEVLPGQVTGSASESVRQPVPAATVSDSSIFPWVSFSYSDHPLPPNGAQTVVSFQSPELPESSAGQLLTGALPSGQAKTAAPQSGLALPRSVNERGSTGKATASSPTSQSISISAFLQMATIWTNSVAVPSPERDLSSIDESLPSGGHASIIEVASVKTVSEPTASTEPVATAAQTSDTNLAIPSTAIGSGIGLSNTTPIPQNAVDHISFELTLQSQSTNDANGPVAAANSANDLVGTVGTTTPPRGIVLRPAAASPGTDSDASDALDDTGDETASRRATGPSNVGSVNILGPATDPGGSVAPAAQVLPTALASHATQKSEAAAASIPAAPTIDLTEAKVSTPSGLVHDVQLRLPGEAGANVSVRLSDRLGQVQISVRSTDQATATTLRQDLSALSASLEKQGWKTDVSELPQRAIHDLRDPSSQQQSDQSGRQRSSPQWEEPPDRRRPNSNDRWAEIDQQETK